MEGSEVKWRLGWQVYLYVLEGNSTDTVTANSSAYRIKLVAIRTMAGATSTVATAISVHLQIASGWQVSESPAVTDLGL